MAALVSVVLLVAILIAAATALAFWAGGLATKQPTTNEPIAITGIPLSNDYVVFKVLIANTGDELISAGTVLTIAENGVTSTLDTGIAPGEQKVVSFIGYDDGTERFFPTSKYTIYGARVGQTPIVMVAVPPQPTTQGKTNVSWSLMGDYNPSLLEVGDIIYLAWDSDRMNNPDYNIFISNTTDGLNWSPSTNISDPQTNKNPTLAHDGTKFGLAWDFDNGPNIHIFTKDSDDSLSWSGKKQAESEDDNNKEPAMIVDQAGNYVLVWGSFDQGNYDIYLKNATSFITFGGEPTIVITTNTSEDSYPSIIQDYNGMYWVAFQSTRGSGGIWMTNSSDRITWEEPWQVPTVSGAMEPSMLHDADGKYWLTYYATEGSYDYIWILYSEDMINWSPNSRVSEAGVIERSPFIIQDSDGVYWMAFEGAVGANYDIYVRSTTNAMFWE